MCGICGVIQVGGACQPVVDRETLGRMTDIMAHRGPDDCGFVYEPGVAIGARRLSIVDLAGGHQPVANETQGVWGAQNGELYNHGSLRRSLANAGHSFRSDCDTEVIPHLYEQYGVDFPTHLRGMFAIVVWDRERRRAVLVRDRLGIKPLYYAHVGDLVVFGSELKSVLASGIVPFDLEPLAIGAYLELGYVPGPLTPFKSVRKLMPGERMVVGQGRVVCERYWEYPKPSHGGRLLAIDESANGLLEQLEESVALRLMSDVPLGAMLSGGLDSSLIVAMMARHSTRPVKTFSVGFAGEPNELGDARLVSKEFATEHHELELDPNTRVDLAELAWHLDEPLADLSALGFLALSKLAAEHVTVALSGQGADELFGGYRKHQAASIAGLARRLPPPLVAAAASAGRRAGGSVGRLAATIGADDAAMRLLAMSSRLDSATRRSLVRGELLKLPEPFALDALQRTARGVVAPPLEATLFLDAQLALVDDMLHYFDRTSMAYSLEVRVPFLDHRLVELAAGIPGRQKVRRLERKAVLKRAARGILPDRIIDKPKVAFFRGAVDGWLKRQLDIAAADALLKPSLACEEFLDPAAVRAFVTHDAQTRAAKPDGQLLLSVVMLEVWLSTTLPAMRKSARGGRAPVAVSTAPTGR